MNRPRILVVGAQHGDERLGPRLQRLVAAQPDRFAGVDYLCGNPRAYRANTRCIERDLNRSYDPPASDTYEARRAQKILKYIRQEGYDYVLDVHTSTADVGRFFITARLDGAPAAVIGSSGFERVVVMPPHIADCSLIGQVSQAISIEYDRNLARKPESLRELATLLDCLLQGERSPRPRDVFTVSGTIAADSGVNLSHRNFTLTEFGFYPILFGEKTYTQHRGFAAYEQQTIVI